MASCDPISAADLQTLLSLQERNQRRWTELGSTFWLQLVISKRSDILTKCAQYQTPTLDFIYIDLLKSLVGKSYGKIHKYFSDVNLLLKSDVSFNNLPNFLKSKSVKEQKCFSEIFKQFFGPQFMTLSSWWLARCFKFHRKMCKVLSEFFIPDENLELVFKFPTFWRHCKMPWPFEVFVRSRWGDGLLKTLACKKEDIIWWSESKKYEFSPPQECKLNSDLYKVVSSLVPLKFSDWLAPYSHTFVHGNYEQEDRVLQFFGTDPAKAMLWDLLELSFPPMWSKKFYSGPAAVTDNFTDSKSLDCCLWISMWLNTIGLEFMSLMHEAQGEFLDHGGDHEEDKLSLKDRMIGYKKTLEFLRSLPNSPARKGTPETSTSFLVDPRLVVQLPWYHNLLQLWLAAALMEVTRCEIASMELRHWPVPETMVSEVSAVLSVVVRCKRILIHGLALLSLDVTHFPNYLLGYPAAVLDQVVLPAYPLLQFLVDHGIAYVTELKRAAWGGGTQGTKSVPVAAYTVKHASSKIFHNHFFHIRYWMAENPQAPYADACSIEPQTETSDPLECTDFFLKKLSTEESLCKASLQNFTPQGDPRELVNRICQEVLSEAPTPEGVKSAKRHALLAIKIAEFTSGLQTEESPSLLRCLVRLTGEALVREQEVRVAAICAQASGHPLTLHDLPPDYDHEKERAPFKSELNKLYIDPQKNIFQKNIDRNTFFSKIVPDPKILTGSMPSKREDYFRNQQSGESIHDHFDKHCKIVMLRPFTVNDKFRAFESKMQHELELDPYVFFYIPANFLIHASETSASSVLLSSYIDTTVENCYRQTEFGPQGYLLNMVRDPTVMDSFTILCSPPLMAMAPKNLDRDLTVCQALATMLTNDPDALIKHIKKTFLLFIHKIPKHKLDARLLSVFFTTLCKTPCLVETMVCEGAFSLNTPSKTHQTFYDLYKVREKVASLSYKMMMFCEGQKLKYLLLCKLLVSMQPKFLEYSIRLLRAAIWQSIVLKDSSKRGHRVENREEFKCSKEMRNEISNYFANVCVVILVLKESEDVQRVSKNMGDAENGGKSQVLESEFNESIINKIKLKIPSRDKRPGIVNQLAREFLQIYFGPNVSFMEAIGERGNPEEKAAAVTTPAPKTSSSPPTEVCDICKKQASTGQNFITFEGKSYCSSQCKAAVQKQCCRYCKKREQPGQKFDLCEACRDDQNYPDPNYFCSEQCWETWWAEEHQAEHLEFELGLGRWYVPPPPE